jgi:Ca-activated chloride channel family protein
VLSLGVASLKGPARTTVTYEERSEGVQAHFLAHRAPKADPLGGSAGYFILLLDADDLGAELAPPRTLSLVIDRSGSMAGSKLDQAQAAALAMLDNLRASDRFNIHTVDSTIGSWRGGATQASKAEVAAARAHVGALTAGGSTDLDGAIITGLGGKSCAAGGGGGGDNRFDAMILISDGRPTAGETNGVQIYKNSIAYNCLEARIFTFAAGSGADLPLLEAIARSARGRNFVLNNTQAASDLAGRVRELFESIHAVRITDLALSIAGIGVHESLPEQPQDLFVGGQVVLVGRYKSPGAGVAKITGRASGAAFGKSLAINAPATEQNNAFIKYVWATEKVGELLAEMGRGGDREKLSKAITELGLGYSIQTPYTSFSTVSGRGGAAGGYGMADAGFDGCSCRLGGGGTGGPGPGLVGGRWLGLALVLLAVAALLLRRRRAPGPP